MKSHNFATRELRQRHRSRMHRMDAVNDPGITTFTNTAASSSALATSEAPVVKVVARSGQAASSISRADNAELFRNSFLETGPSPGPAHSDTTMSAASAHDWPANERLAASLVAQVAVGDERALAKLYDSTSRMVYGLCLRVVKDPTAAEDITLETYLQLWRTAGSYDPARGSVTAWLLTVVRSRSIDWLRARKARRADLEQNLDDVFSLKDHRPSPEHASIEASRTRVIREAMAGLPDDQRRAIELTYFSGLSHSEIAVHTGLPLGTVKTRIRLGMMRLRELLGPHAEGL